jgi:hypothetical protein
VIYVVCAVDFVYRGQFFHPGHELSFCRMGYADATSASIVSRAPQGAILKLQLRSNSELHDTSTSLSLHNLSEETDWVGTLTLNKLQPDTMFVYNTNASHTGTSCHCI